MIQDETSFYTSDNTVTNVYNLNTADNIVTNVWVLETEITFFIADILWHQYNLNRTIEKNNRDEIY